MVPELCLVIPTYNEKDNLGPLLDSLYRSLEGIRWELIFVDDDSGDNTAAAVRQLSEQDDRVRCIQRIHRKGLASACIEGILASSAPYVAVMDADMQHDDGILPDMLHALRGEDLDIVIGSRYMQGGSTGELSPHRVWISRAATYLSGLVLKQEVSDPLSGYFMLRRTFFEKVMHRLSGRGFKILLDILVTAGPSVKFREIPYDMRQRVAGDSKLGLTVIWEFFTLIFYKLLGRMLPARFISFAAVGLSGIFVHLFVLWCFHRVLQTGFVYSQVLATLVAMTSNYFLNNIFTYSDRMLRGRAFIRGLFSFYVACSIGAVVNVAVADFLFNNLLPWWLAGGLGAVAGAVWNYATTATFTWRITGNRGE